MTLEQFFTEPELKDGLADPTRVNDLITAMQNQKENTVEMVSEATRKWSAVATTIAITDNKECLDLFIRLDGLGFIDKWINDAQKLVNDAGDGGLEALVIGLLRAVERLQVDHHQSVFSAVGLTVQRLLGHSSLVVQEKAKELCDRWAPVPTDINSVNEENLEQPTCTNAAQQETVEEDIVIPEVIMDDENDKFKSESTPLAVSSGPLEDAKEKLEVDSLTLTSSTDVDHATTNNETMEDKSEKDEVMVDGEESQSLDRQNPKTELNAASDSASGAGLRESSGSENPKLSSNTETDVDMKEDSGMKSDDDSGNRSPLTKPLTKSKNDDLTSKRPSDMDLDYGMVDPLELARQVAIEVELEVDSPEQSCSTSTKGSPEPEPETGPHAKGSHGAPEPMNDSETLNPKKGFSGFDLNEEVPFDETERSETDRLVDPLSNPVSVLSDSRPTAGSTAGGPPVAPLQFEGPLGWKGSAANSAFRRVPEAEKTFSPSSSHSNSSQRLSRFDFDLNVAEDSEDKIQDFFLPRDFEEPSRPQLDLNFLGDGGGPQNGPKSPFISSTIQPTSRNIDLNLNVHSNFPNNVPSNNPFLSKLFNNKRDESVISIFGTQVEVNRKDKLPYPQPNGKFLEPSLDFNLGRSGSGWLGPSMSYSNPPAYGYGHNGFTMGLMYDPPGAPVPPIPYMVDSRGAPIIPPMQPTLSQPTQPFFFNMAAPSSSNGAGPSRNTLDPNMGLITERGNHENNNFGLRQFFNHNQASSSSVIGGKRDEPDSGWELFPTNYKRQQPPWQ